MNISPINNITKRTLPLVASAAISLGALASCSSGNKANKYPTYREDIVMLDNTLDSLKQVKAEDKINFLEYYSQSKDAIKKTEFNSPNKDVPGNTTERIGLGALVLGTLGFILGSVNFQLLGGSNRSYKFALTNAAIAGIGVMSFIAGIIQKVSYNQDQIEIIEHHKTIQMNRLNYELLNYLNTKDLKLSKEEIDMLK